MFAGIFFSPNEPATSAEQAPAHYLYVRHTPRDIENVDVVSAAENHAPSTTILYTYEQYSPR